MNTPYQSYTLQGQERIIQPVQQQQQPAVSTMIYVRNHGNNIFNPNHDQMVYRRNGLHYTTGELEAIIPSNTFPRLAEARPLDVSASATYSGYPATKNDSLKSPFAMNNRNVYTLSINRNKYENVPSSQCYRQFVFPSLNLKTEDRYCEDVTKHGTILNNQTTNQISDHTNTHTNIHTNTQSASPARIKKTVKLPPGCTGLINLGSTCYMNSVLQCLSHTKFLVDYCMEQKQKQNNRSKNSKAILANALAGIFKQMWSGMRICDPSDFRKKMLSIISGFSDDACQEDAQEFLMFLLDSLHADLKIDLKKKHTSVRLFPRRDIYADSAWKKFLESENGVVVDIFMGQLRSSLTCTSCQQVSHTFEPAQQLILPIPKTRNGTKLTLDDCLSRYFHKETLLADEKPACSVCGRKSDSTKCLSMQKFPKIFVIQLNRFCKNEDCRVTKITTPVYYPIKNLNFKKFAYVDANVIYNLYAVVEHVGNLDNGHYMAIIKNKCNNNWYHYDDDIVRPMHENRTVTESAYILFYELHSAEKEKSSSVATLNLQNLFIDRA